MKKLVFVALIGLFISTAAFADHEGFGIGIVGGGGYYGFGTGYGALSLKIPKVPIFWGISLPWHGGFGLGITGDFYIFDNNLVTQNMTNDDGTYKFKLDWYLGLGAFGNFYFSSGYGGADVGFRVPIGLSWHIIKQLELFLALVPGVGFFIDNGGVGPHFAGSGEIGLRVWL
ncbi:MAG: hypothetical protein LBH20_02945 [Treponema sp.]|nr:hypothetical protein [Treponema sp.]